MKRSMRVVRAGHRKRTDKDKNWLQKNLYIGEFIAIIAAIFGVYAYVSEGGDRRDERLARAWSVLTNKASGNSGKIEALEFLIEQSVSLTGIDLSCEAMGGGWDSDALTCERPTYLQGVNLSGADLTNSNLKGVNMQSANLGGANLGDSYLNGANLWNADLTDTVMWGADLTDVDLSHSNLTGVNLYYAILAEANLSDANLSGVDFQDSVIDGASFFGAWSWSDQLPTGLAGIEIEACSNEGLDTPREKPETGCTLQVME